MSLIKGLIISNVSDTVDESLLDTGKALEEEALLNTYVQKEATLDTDTIVQISDRNGKGIMMDS